MMIDSERYKRETQVRAHPQPLDVNFSFGIFQKDIYYIAIITYSFRTKGTKVKALQEGFDKEVRPEFLVGYVSVDDGNGVELFEKTHDR